MADTGVEFGATPRGVAKLLRDDGTGTHSEVVATQLWIWDSGTLEWRKATDADFTSAGGGGTQYTEDAAAAANPVGNAQILVRADTPATVTSTDGDNVAQRGTNYGASYVTLLDTGGNAVSVGGGTQYTEDAAAAADPIGNAQILVRADALAAVTSTDGDNIATRGTNKGEVYVKHVDAIPVTDNSGSLTVDNAALAVTGGGAEATALRVTIASDSTGVLSIDDNGATVSIDDGAGSITVDNGGTFAVQATLAAGATNIAKAEDVASADADVGVPAMAVRKATPANTSSLDGDYEMLQMSAGRLWVDASGKTLTVDASGVAVPVTDNGGSLTVDNAALSVTGGGVEATALRVTLASDSTGVVSVDDNGSSLTVDGTVTVQDGGGAITVDNAGTFAVQADTELTTADLDTGAGTDTRAVVGLVGSKSGGGQLIPGDATAGLKVDLGADNDVTITSGTVTTITNVVHVDDNSSSLTVDNAGTFAVQATLQAGTALAGRVSSSDETSTVYNGTTALTPKFAKISTSSSGASEVVALVGGKKIRVLSYTLVANAAVNVKFQSHTTPTDLTGLLYLAANGGVSSAYAPVGLFETVSGEALDINLSGAVAVGGHLTYIEV